MSFRSKITFRRKIKTKRARADFTRLSIQEKPKVIDPLDYEAVISELWEELKEDPLRELLLFPDNDFSVSERFQWFVPLWRKQSIGSQLHSGFIESLTHTRQQETFLLRLTFLE
uniref:DOC10 n=1 Tax=Poeciliopsis prolifica TaxID=188132 RepID=A0A0S7ETG1_9TELE